VAYVIITLVAVHQYTLLSTKVTNDVDDDQINLYFVFLILGLGIPVLLFY
jgi:hypothetical protein